MRTESNHLLVEYWDCDRKILNDLECITTLMGTAAHAAGATVVGSIFKPFDPQGVSGVVVVEESHLSIHTWPENGYAAVDIFTCGHCSPEKAHRVLLDGLRAHRYEKMLVRRGLVSGAPSMRGKN